MTSPSFKNCVNEILADKAILPVKQNSHSSPAFHLDLLEDGKDATLKRLKLIHISDADTCITFDVAGDQKFKTFSAYLKSSKKHRFNKAAGKK